MKTKSTPQTKDRQRQERRPKPAARLRIAVERAIESLDDKVLDGLALQIELYVKYADTLA
jgi:hypothetical protein